MMCDEATNYYPRNTTIMRELLQAIASIEQSIDRLNGVHMTLPSAMPAVGHRRGNLEQAMQTLHGVSAELLSEARTVKDTLPYTYTEGYGPAFALGGEQ